MKAARVHGREDVRIDDIEEPVTRPQTVKIKIAFSGICGSDLGVYMAGPPEPRTHPLIGEPPPHVLGHEFSGHITDVGEGVEALAVGDHVAVRPTLACHECPTCLAGQSHLCPNWAGLGFHGGGGDLASMSLCP